MFEGKEALLLDMNSTFMFGEDRFGKDEVFSEYYKSIGGKLPNDFVDHLIRRVYEYLEQRYPAVEYRQCFPSLDEAITTCSDETLSEYEKDRVMKTFSFHEHGSIPKEYVSTLQELNEKFTLSLVVDIWAPKDRWINTFKELGIWELFSAHSFSSDHGIVKPSKEPFEMLVKKLGIANDNCLVVGDSIRRDLGGAQAAGIDCVLVGEAQSPQAMGTFRSLLEFTKAMQLKSD